MADLGINPKLPSWDGDWRTFDDYKLACQLEYDGLKEEDLVTLAPRLTRNLTGKAWEACTEVDRAKLRKPDGLDYLLGFLRQKGGKKQVDILGEAFEKYFQNAEVLREDKECLNDCEQRMSTFTRDIELWWALYCAGAPDVDEGGSHEAADIREFQAVERP